MNNIDVKGNLFIPQITNESDLIELMNTFKSDLRQPDVYYLDKEKDNSRNILDLLYNKMSYDYVLNSFMSINPLFMLFVIENSPDERFFKNGYHIMYPSILAYRKMQIHERYLGLLGGFTCSVISRYGYNSFSVQEMLQHLAETHKDITFDTIAQKMIPYLRLLLIDHVLIVTTED